MSNSAGVKKPSKANYKLKYKLLKRCVKEIVLENAALCDRASEIQHQILVAQEERKFLWKKYTATQGNNFNIEDMIMNSGAPSQPVTEQKKTRRTPTQKTSSSSKPRQSLSSRQKQKRKLDETLSNDTATLANG
ncbi:transforming growth factor beta regulator 1-like [Daphnia carinata]|uniref:transforming growth factor beta regulator 1-like n=1 Tax=Daphnia carinata TaxID=120202 RepID=UPI00257B9428|nr:transforming growth factor beta regulator 1-like [Daphnia carinata]XP_059353127.1 transforming growth factor beta regulator 1-like [Daphnia carinata]